MWSKAKLDNPTALRPFDNAAKPWVVGKPFRVFLLSLTLTIYYFLAAVRDDTPRFRYGHHGYPSCSQAEELKPIEHGALWYELGQEIGTDVFKTKAVELLGGAVRIPTESHDTFGPVGEDHGWDIFEAFHEYLLKSFPLIHTKLKLTKINTYGLVYHWAGSSPDLKPLLLAAHQDVVPVEPQTVSQWTWPPYSGHFDGESIWGRGASDDKSGLIGIMITVETMLKRNFTPRRGVVLAFGFDEEITGFHGAKYISEYLLKEFGQDGFAALFDEGGGFSEQFGGVFAVPGIAEKGYMDVSIEVHTAGGHSSIPPKHTSIGMLASLLVKLEKKPSKSQLKRHTPVYYTAQCFAEYAPDLPPSLRRNIRRSATSDRALRDAEKELFERIRSFESLAGTTQAIDLVSGGVKINALPEQARAVVNHRIATDSSADAVKARDTTLFKELASKFNLSYTAFGVALTDDDVPRSGSLVLAEAFHPALDPAPVTPIDGAPYELLSGTIKATYNAHRSLQGNQNIVVAPGIMTGNTDTRHYWALTKHIFRYNQQPHGNGTVSLGKIHTVDENIGLETFLEVIRFWETLILNADEAKTF